MGTNFWELLQQRQDQLTRSGHAVADYLLQHADEAQYLPFPRWPGSAMSPRPRCSGSAGRSGSTATTRCALRWRRPMPPAPCPASGSFSPGLTTETLFEHASARLFTAINGTQNALSAEAVDEAARMLREAKQVFCFGQGGSMLLANDICARFASLSTKFRTSGDSHLQLLTASLMNEADVVLFVSYPVRPAI